jgi:cytochrome c
VAGTQPNFSYSPAMKASQIRWNRANLLAFVGQPSKLVPGTRMPFAGIQDKAKANQIVDYLLTLR